jgi:hypothetical protein
MYKGLKEREVLLKQVLNTSRFAALTSHVIYENAEREDYRRSIGGVSITPPVPQSLCRKAFPAITGGGEVFLKVSYPGKS